jgi:hypothetical protein
VLFLIEKGGCHKVRKLVLDVDFDNAMFFGQQITIMMADEMIAEDISIESNTTNSIFADEGYFLKANFLFFVK